MYPWVSPPWLPGRYWPWRGLELAEDDCLCPRESLGQGLRSSPWEGQGRGTWSAACGGRHVPGVCLQKAETSLEPLLLF